jgi:hypothetical protein
MEQKTETIPGFGVQEDESLTIEEQYKIFIPSIEKIKDANGSIQIKVDAEYDEERDRVLHWLRNSEWFEARGVCTHYAEDDIPPLVEISHIKYEGNLTKNQILSFMDDFGHYMSATKSGHPLVDYNSDGEYVKFTGTIPPY